MPTSRPIVTLLTDFGTRDHYVGVMKGMILRQCRDAVCIDLCHQVPAHDILAGALLLDQAIDAFEPDTVHLVVIDPGVGTARAILAARFGSYRFVFPDNGLITLVARRLPLSEMAIIDPRTFVDSPSGTFHGRDVMAPAAGALAAGRGIGRLGPEPTSYHLLDVPQPARHNGRIVGEVIYVDHFGNLVTNIPARDVHALCPNLRHLRVECAGRTVEGVHGTYGYVKPGEPLALLDSLGMLEVAVNRGRGSDYFSAGLGAPVTVQCTE